LLVDPRTARSHTLDVLPLVVTDVSRDVQGVTDKRVATSVVHGRFELGIVLDGINGELSFPIEVAVFVVRRLGLNAVKRDEGRLAEALVAKVLQCGEL
jgi:hypothetical protein